jgi:hypothetical protein
MRVVLVAAAALALSAPAASADTQYGGTATYHTRPGLTITLVRHDDGRVDARTIVNYACRKHELVNEIVRLKGSTGDGVNVTASGKKRLFGRGMVRLKLTGALAPDSVSGKVTMGLKGCPKYTYGLVLRTESAPAGAPAVPAASTLFNGLTGQAAGGIRLPVAVRVTAKGRVWARWQAEMKCGPKAVISMGNTTPTSAVKPDGTFSRSETYTIRYTDDSSERFRVSFKGRFLADGVVGTLRARMQTRRKGHSYYPCDSGQQTWTARL